MFDSLRKKLEESFADINPFDNGATGATVRAQRAAKPAPAKTVSRPQQAPQRTLGQQSFNTNKFNPTKVDIGFKVPAVKPLPVPKPKQDPNWLDKGIKGVSDAFTKDLPVVAQETTKAAGEVAKTIAQGAARVPETVARSVYEPLTGNAFVADPRKAVNTDSAHNTGIREFLYGKAPVQSYQSQARDLQIAGQDSKNKFIQDASKLAPFAAPAMAALDLFGVAKGGMPITKKVVEATGDIAQKGTSQVARRADDIVKQPGYNPEAGFAKVPTNPNQMPSPMNDAPKLKPEIIEVPSVPQASAKLSDEEVLGGFGDVRTKFGNDKDFYEQFILPEADKPTRSADLAIQIVGKVENEGIPLSQAIDESIAPTPKFNIVEAEAAHIDGQLDDLKRTIRDLEKSTGQTGLFQSVAKNMVDMNAEQQLDYMGGALRNMRDRGVLLADHVNKQNGYTPPATKPRPQVTTKLVSQQQRRPQPIARPYDPEPTVSQEPTPIRQILEEKQARVGEQFSKPREVFPMTKGRIDLENPGTILSESKGGTQRKRLITNQEKGINEVITETRNPDGSWTASVDREPAFDSTNDIKGIAAVENNEEVNRAAAQAIQDGKEIHLFADKGTGDPNSRGVSVQELDPEKHVIDGGFVRDAKTNEILGNHIKIDETGMSMNIGKKIVNMDDLTGDPAKWKDINKTTYTMDRILEKAAPDDATYRKVRSFVIDHKQKSEAGMRIDLQDYRTKVKEAKDTLTAAKPSGVSKKDYYTDIFHFAEKKLEQPKGMADGTKLTQEGILDAKYGKDTADAIKTFDEWARKEYDSLLDRTNEVLRRFGHDEVRKRDNYMTHLQEDSLWDQIGIGDDLYRDLTSGIKGEANPSNRGKLPGNIAGLTEDFKPTKKYNPFHQARRGKDSMTDPFKAMDAYGEAALFNIHMTESAVRARSLESVFRAAEEVTNKDMLKQVNETLRKSLKESLSGSRGDLTNAFQEYANALAGKSEYTDRYFQDKRGKAGRVALKLARAFQKIAAQSSIAGNFSVTVAQSLNLPNNIGTNGIKNTTKGIGRMLSDISLTGEPKLGSPASRSNFLKVRYTDAQSKINKSVYQRANDVVSKATLMPYVERAFVELTWNSSYEKALTKGFSGRAAVKEADRIAERIIAGRGIGDQPEMYRSTAVRTLLQYTLEVNAALKNVRHDMGPAGIAKYAAAVFALNYVMEQTTGRAPLPDFVGATVDTANDFADQSDKDSDGKPDETIGDKLAQTGQRFASQAVKMHPGVSSGVNTLVPTETQEMVFGKDSDIARYEGAPAATSAISKGVQAFISLLNGNTPDAADDALSVVPFGGQIRKTTQGLDAMNKGYTENASGKVTATVDQSSPINWVKAALFGKNAIPEVKAYYEGNASPLSENQTKVFDELKKVGGDSAKQYAESIFNKRDDAKTAKEDTVVTEELDATAKVKLADGTWKEENGVLVDKNGKVQRDHYRDLAKSKNDESDDTYKAYMLGYSLEDETPKQTKGSATKTNNAAYDSLLSKDDEKVEKKSKSGTAVGMFSNDSKYDGIPDWVKDRYYEEAGFKKEEVQYAALADVDKDTKLDNYYRPLAQSGDRKALLDELYRGRTKGIKNDYMMAQDSIITALQKEGYLSKEEAKALKAVKLERDGKTVDAASAAAAKSGGGKKGKKSKKGKFDYKLFGFGSQGPSNSKQLHDLLKKAKLK